MDFFLIFLSFQSFDKNVAEDPNFKKTVDIAVVAAEKDFPLIKKCLFFASNSLDSYFSGKVYVIVPEASKQKCSQSLRELEEFDIEIISEDEIIDRLEGVDNEGEQLVDLGLESKCLNLFGHCCTCDVFLVVP